MSGRRRAQLRNVDGFGEVHLEQSALAEGERNCVLRVLYGLLTPSRRELPHRRFGVFHREFVIGADTGGVNFWRCVKAMNGREILHDLNASAMAVHVAEAADVHKNVEAKV